MLRLSKRRKPFKNTVVLDELVEHEVGDIVRCGKVPDIKNKGVCLMLSSNEKRAKHEYRRSFLIGVESMAMEKNAHSSIVLGATSSCHLGFSMTAAHTSSNLHERF